MGVSEEIAWTLKKTKEHFILKGTIRMKKNFLAVITIVVLLGIVIGSGLQAYATVYGPYNITTNLTASRRNGKAKATASTNGAPRGKQNYVAVYIRNSSGTAMASGNGRKADRVTVSISCNDRNNLARKATSYHAVTNNIGKHEMPLNQQVVITRSY